MARSWSKKIADAEARGDLKAASDIRKIRDRAQSDYAELRNYRTIRESVPSLKETNERINISERFARIAKQFSPQNRNGRKDEKPSS